MLTQAARRFWITEREILRASAREAQVTSTMRNWVGMGLEAIVVDLGREER